MSARAGLQTAGPDRAGGLSCPAAVRKALRFIRANLSRPIDGGMIAEAAGLSPYHFSRLFKRSTGLTPHQFLLRERIERSKHLLLGGGHSLADIAQELCFYDQSHFCLVFKRLAGLTPKQFIAKFSAEFS